MVECISKQERAGRPHLHWGRLSTVASSPAFPLPRQFLQVTLLHAPNLELSHPWRVGVPVEEAITPVEERAVMPTV